MKRAALALAPLLLAAAAGAQTPAYDAVEIPSLWTYGLRARALNNNGHVVGYMATDWAIPYVGLPVHAFLYANGVVTDLFPQDARWSRSEATAINDDGEIVGFRGAGPSSYLQPFHYKDGQGSVLNPFDLPPGSALVGSAHSINNAGQIVGGASPTLFGFSHAFLLTPEVPSAEDLDPDLSYPYFGSTASAVNGAGHVVGTLARVGTSAALDTQDSFFWDGAGHRYPDDLLEGASFTPGAINDGDLVAGTVSGGTQPVRAAVYDGIGFSFLPGLPEATASRAFGINAGGDVVGSSTLPDGTGRAVLWRDGHPHDLNALLVTDLGVVLAEAAAINDSGQVAAWGGGFGAPMRSFLLTPATPRTRIGGLIDDVERLVETGTLKPGQGTSLIVKLERALGLLAQGMTEDALTMLEAFVHEVRAFRNAGILEPEVADGLIARGEAAIASIAA